MDVAASDRSPDATRPAAARSPVGPRLQPLVCNLFTMRTALRALVLVAALCVIVAVVSGSSHAGGGRVADTALEPLPILLLSGRSGAATAISITCPADATAPTGTGHCSASVAFSAAATPGPGCRLLGIAYAIGTTQITSPHTFLVGTTTVTAGAADSCGGTATCTFRVTVVDQEPPVVTCPANITVDAAIGGCSQSISFGAAATDNCSVASLKYYLGTTEIHSPYIFYVGINTIRVEARDPAGNTSSCTFQVTVRDTQPPHIVCPANISTPAGNGVCTAGVSFAASATDNCPVWPVRYYIGATEITSPHAFPEGATTVRAEARDATGNTASCTFQVTVNDTQPPWITCPADMTVPNDPGLCGAVVNYGIVAGDNCPTATWRASPPSGSAFPVGTTTVTATADDTHGNSATCTFHVTVRDTQPPTITCPANTAVNADSGSCTASVLWQGAGGTDNCPPPWYLRYYIGATQIWPPYSFRVGTTSVRAELSDASGNVDTCTFQVAVRDAHPPGVTCPADIAANTDAGRCSASVPFAATATDDCGLDRLRYYTGTTEIHSPYAFAPGTATVRAVASDLGGNTAECSFHVIVRDNERPSISCPAAVHTEPDPGTNHASSVAVGTATATDPCGAPVVNSTRADGKPLGDPYPLGRTTITWTAQDGAGNSSSCTQEVWVGTGQIARLYLPCLLRQ